MAILTKPSMKHLHPPVFPFPTVFFFKDTVFPKKTLSLALALPIHLKARMEPELILKSVMNCLQWIYSPAHSKGSGMNN